MESLSQNLRLSNADRRWRPGAILLMIVLPFAVQNVYFDSGFYYDDDFHLEQSEKIGRGDISLTSYVTLVHGEHLIPLWKLMFYCCWTVFGENSVGMHIVVTAFHATAALLLYALVRHYVSERSALICGVLWAGSAIGGWDGPFLWIAASHLSIGFTFLLAAMLCLTRYSTLSASDGGPNSHPNISRRWALAMGGCVLLCLMTMGSLLILTPVLLIQFWLFEYRKSESIRAAVPWLVCWLIPCVVVGVLHLVWVLPAMERLDRPPVNVFSGLQMLGGGYAVSSWNLLFWTGNAVLWGRILGGILLAVLVMRTGRQIQKISLLFFALSFSFSVLAYMARSGWEVGHVLMWGRYRYLPTLFWCVVLCGALDYGLDWLQSRNRKVVPWAVFVTLSLFVFSQGRIASQAALVFRQISDDAARQARHDPHETQAATALAPDLHC